RGLTAATPGGAANFLSRKSSSEYPPLLTNPPPSLPRISRVAPITTSVTPNDQNLLNRIAKRDEGALTQLYDRYGAAALATAARVLGDRSEAEDVVQEVFVRVWDRAA